MHFKTVVEILNCTLDTGLTWFFWDFLRSLLHGCQEKVTVLGCQMNCLGASQKTYFGRLSV